MLENGVLLVWLIDIYYENTKTNIADMLTKIQSGPVRLELARMAM